MFRITLSVLLLSAAVPAMADNCYGTGRYRTCTDPSTGSQYTTTRYGNTSQTSGYNPTTGNQWNQTSTRYGNTTTTNGYDANGNYWNETTTRHGNTTTTNGTDSDGNYYSRTCNQYGCY